MITAEQIRAARALMRLEQTQLAEKAGVSVETIKRVEQQSGPVKATTETTTGIEDALRREGVDFIDSSPEGGPGVRLALDKTKYLQERLVREVISLFAAALQARAQNNPSFFEPDLSFSNFFLELSRYDWKAFRDRDRAVPGSPESPFYGGSFSAGAVVEPASELGSRAGRASDMTATTTAESWLKDEGVEIVARRCSMTNPNAEKVIQQWSSEIDGDVVALVRIIGDADRYGVASEKFFSVVGGAVRKIVGRRNPRPGTLHSLLSSDRHADGQQAKNQSGSATGTTAERTTRTRSRKGRD